MTINYDFELRVHCMKFQIFMFDNDGDITISFLCHKTIIKSKNLTYCIHAHFRLVIQYFKH